MSTPHHNPSALAQSVTQALEQYFAELHGVAAHGVYDMVLHQVELTMLRCVMEQCERNQTRAAAMLGLNRNTLRKKLIQHNLIE